MRRIIVPLVIAAALGLSSCRMACPRFRCQPPPENCASALGARQCPPTGWEPIGG